MKKKRILLGLVLSTAFIGAAIGMTSCAGGENPSASTSEPATQSGDQSTGEADPYADYVKISNVDEFLAFRQLENTSKKFVLTADIDLEGVELEATQVYLRGTFDGNGHAIKNATYSTNAMNKSGILCREIIGGTVKNVRFVNCSAAIQDETIGIVSGMVSGNVTFSQLEFIACTASCNNYAGMLTGRISSSGTKLVADQITTKNGCRTSITSYGGFLLSDIAGGASATDQNEIIFTNMDIAGEVKGGNINGGFLSGRIRNNTKFTVENTVVRNATLGSDKMGLIAGGGTTNGKNVNVNYKNVAILNTNASVLQSLGDLMAESSLGTGEFLTTYSLENVFLPNGCTLTLGDGSGTIKAKSEITALSADVTPAWLTETLHLDFTDTWKTEGTDNAKYRLIAASTNVKSADATLASIKATTTNTQTRFKKGEDFSSDGLVVTATYSDDVQLVLTNEDFDVISTAYNKEASGTYTISIKAKEKNAAGADVTTSYDVLLASQTGIKLNTEFTKLVYAKGEDLNLKNLLVYSVWDDGIEEKEVNDESKQIVRYTVDDSTFDKTTAGGYTLTVAMTGFDAKTIKVNVVDSKPTVVDGKIYINVDGAANIAVQGTKVNGVETFTTITNAIDYLSSINLADNVDKVIYIADGTYTEKITIPATLKNVKFIGESRENTIIAYDAVEGTLNPLTESVYKMDCATLHVNSTGFGLENITVKNTFDYINDASKYGDPQGFALTIAADGAVLNNVYLYGNQDTLFFKAGRVYIKNSRIDGNVDFIFGENNGLAFFDNCVIHAVYRGNTNNTGYVTAMKGDTGSTKPAYGYIFNGCTFEADSNVNDGSMSLGRPWGGGATVAMINCSFTKAYSTLGYTSDDKTKSRWFSMSGNSPVNADFCEYGSTGEGAITTAVDGGKVLTAEQAANYTAANLFAATNGGVTWDAAFDYAAALTALQGMATTVSGEAIAVNSSIQNDAIEVFATGTYDLTPYVTPWNASNKEITAVVNDPTVASYANGVVTGIAEGQSTTITLTCGSLTKVITVTVATGTFYQVDFVTDGSAVASQSVLEGQAIAPVTTTLDGCKFVGWYTDESYTTPFDTTTSITTAKTLYAKFVVQSLFDPVDDASENWAAYDQNGNKLKDGTASEGSAKTYWLLQADGGDNKAATISSTTTGAVSTYKLETSNKQYLQGDVLGYTKSVNLILNAGTTSTSNAVEVTVKAYDAAGNVLDTKTGNTTAKCTTKFTFTLTSTTANIAYVRVTSTTASRNIGVTYAELTYERNADERSNTNITFGTEGTYTTPNAAIDVSGATISDLKADGGAKVNGTVTVDVKAGGVVYVASYQYYANFDFVVGSNAPVHFEKQSGYIQVTEDTTVTIQSTGYLSGIYVLYQTANAGWTLGSNNVDNDMKVTLQKKSLVYNGLVSDATWSDGSSTTKIDYTNNGSYSQNNTHSFVLFVAPANSTVTVVTYDANFKINGVAVTGTGSDIATTIKVGAPQLIVIEATGNSYIKSISIA